MPRRVYPLVEAISPKPYEVEEGRGAVDKKGRRMEVPLDDSPLGRRVRLHETSHAQLSPERPTVPDGIPASAIQHAEDLRMNLHGHRLGLGEVLLDGALDADEVTKIATNYATHPVLALGGAAATYNTGDHETYMKGLAKANPMLAAYASVFGPKAWEALDSVEEPAYEDAVRLAQMIVDWSESDSPPQDGEGEGEGEGQGSGDEGEGEGAADPNDYGKDEGSGSAGDDDADAQDSDADGEDDETGDDKEGDGKDDGDAGDDSDDDLDELDPGDRHGAGDTEGKGGRGGEDGKGKDDSGNSGGSKPSDADAKSKGKGGSADSKTGDGPDSRKGGSGTHYHDPAKGFKGGLPTAPTGRTKEIALSSAFDEARRIGKAPENDEVVQRGAPKVRTAVERMRKKTAALGYTRSPRRGGEVRPGRMTIEKPNRTKRLPQRIIGRKKRVSPEGRVPRRMNRFATDRAIFEDRGKKPGGGTVLIDTSGSMSLSAQEIKEIMELAPAATIAAYSGSGTRGSLRILAKDGLRVSDTWIRDNAMPYGGNVVDLPALEWLAKMPKPRLWVSDGYVTGHGDQLTLGLVEACAKLCLRHDILRLPRVRAVEAWLRNAKEAREAKRGARQRAQRAKEETVTAKRGRGHGRCDLCGSRKLGLDPVSGLCRSCQEDEGL